MRLRDIVNNLFGGLFKQEYVVARDLGYQSKICVESSEGQERIKQLEKLRNGTESEKKIVLARMCTKQQSSRMFYDNETELHGVTRRALAMAGFNQPPKDVFEIAKDTIKKLNDYRKGLEEEEANIKDTRTQFYQFKYRTPNFLKNDSDAKKILE